MKTDTFALVMGHGAAAKTLDLMLPSYANLGLPIIYASPWNDPLVVPGVHIHAGRSDQMISRLIQYLAQILALPFDWKVCLMVQYDQYIVGPPPPYPGWTRVRRS